MTRDQLTAGAGVETRETADVLAPPRASDDAPRAEDSRTSRPPAFEGWCPRCKDHALFEPNEDGEVLSTCCGANGIAYDNQETGQ